MNRSTLLCLLLWAMPTAWAQTAATPVPADSAAMAAARAALYRQHGGAWVTTALLERLELQTNEGDLLAAWQAEASVGGDVRKLKMKTEGEYLWDDREVEAAEFQLLYSQAIHPFWDAQIGVRHDLQPDPTRTYLVAALQGTAPYWVEIDGSIFLSDQGDWSARLELEYELRLAQNLVLQPRLEIYAAAQEDPDIELSAGLSHASVGIRLQYAFTPQFSPYVGVHWERAFGDSADGAGNHNSSRGSVVAGVRMWF